MRRLAASSGYWSSDGSPPSGFTLTVPGSDILDQDIFHGRRAFLGGSVAGAWCSFMQDGTLFAIAYFHLRGANPANWVPALQSATIINVDLGGVSRSPDEVGALTQAALDASPVTGVSRVGAAISIAGATGAQLGPPIDPTQPSRRGMWGIQRTDYGVGFDGLAYTPAIATTLRHIVSPGAGRVIGMYVYGRTAGTDYLPRLAVGRGPYSPTPTNIEILAQGVITSPVQEGLPSFLLFDEPVAIGLNEDLVVLQRCNTGEVGFRLESANPIAFGNFTGGTEELVIDTSVSDPATPFGATYTPGTPTTAPSIPTMGLIFELDDGVGVYPGDGALRGRIGDQNNDPTHGTQGTAGPGIVDQENLEFRFPMMQWTDVFFVGDDWAIASLDPGDNMGSKMYIWPDLNVPAIGPVPLLADLGPVNPQAGGIYNSRTYTTPVPVGTNVIGANQIVGFGTNFGRDGGGAVTGLTATFFADTNAGDNNYQNAWLDDQDGWHDYIPVGGGGFGSASGAPTEYAARGADGSLMPTRDPNPVWPPNYLINGAPPPTDTALINIPIFRQYFVRPGLSLS